MILKHNKTELLSLLKITTIFEFQKPKRCMRLLKSISFNFLLALLSTLFLCACSKNNELELDYSFETAINVEHDVEDFDQIDFTPNTNLDLGFYKGNIWIKLNITNNIKPGSYVIITDDLINRNYRFYKLDTLTNRINPVLEVTDLELHDHRTFNYPKPNFEINLSQNEKATYFIMTQSDGRIVKSTPHLLKIEEFTSFMSQTTMINIIFFVVIGVLFLINLFHWSILKNRIYYFYGFYLLSSLIFYYTVEGYLNGIVDHYIIDHVVFVSIRVWILSVSLFTSKFLELDVTYPKFYKLIKWVLFVILGGTTLYQLLFFNTSIAHLHLLENLFGFIWMLIAVLVIGLSLKKRKLQTKYYLLTFSFLVIFIALGLINSHTALLPGDPFSYFKVGMIIEFTGFTYFITLIIKRNLKKTTALENELLQNKKELRAVSNQLETSLESKLSQNRIDKTDLLNIFKLLESTLSTEEDWLEFKSKFEQLSPNFLPKLKEQHSNLSKSEIRLLTLIKIGFTQKEIAGILNIEPASVKKAKQRVRKKLELAGSVILTQYLNGFT